MGFVRRTSRLVSDEDEHELTLSAPPRFCGVGCYPRCGPLSRETRVSFQRLKGRLKFDYARGILGVPEFVEKRQCPLLLTDFLVSDLQGPGPLDGHSCAQRRKSLEVAHVGPKRDVQLGSAI